MLIKRLLLSFSNYVCGSEEETNSLAYTKYQASFLKNFRFIFTLMFPKFFTACTLVFVLLLVDVIALEFVVYHVGLLGGQFYKSLSSKDLNKFKNLAIISVAWILLNSLMVSLKDFFAQMLSIIWRKNITFKLHDLYFSSKNFYYIQQQLPASESLSDSSVRSTTVLIESGQGLARHKTAHLDNPDQRITQDVSALCKSFSTILPILLISPFVICFYMYQAFLSIGYPGPLTVIIYFIVWAIVNGPLTNPIARVIYKQDRKEGDFRFKHMNLRINAESIALYDSSEMELASINGTFKSLLDILYRRNWKEVILNFFVITSQYMGGIIAYIILGIPIFTNIYNDLTPDELAQFISNYSFKCQYLIYLFTRLFNTFDEISSVNGNAQRISELFDKMSKNLKNKLCRTKSHRLSHSHDNSLCFKIQNLTLTIPDKSKILIKNLNLEFRQNENILITGRSGCGKTSLFRSISGLWSFYSGEIKINSNDKKLMDPTFLFFLPQKPYFTSSGSLIDQIVYPRLESSISKSYLESIRPSMNDWLKKFHLEHLIEMIDSDLSAKPLFEWQNVLSPGEQQRLSFLRVLFHHPKFILLDEFTSSVDQETETQMYETLKEAQITYLSIAHRDTVRKYHHIELKILNDASYQIINLETSSN